MTSVWLASRDILARPLRALLVAAVVAGCAALVTYSDIEETARDAAISGELDGIAAPLRVVADADGAPTKLLSVADVERVREAGGRGVRAVEPWLVFDANVAGVRTKVIGAAPGSRQATTVPAGGVVLGNVLAERLGAYPGVRILIAGRAFSVGLRPPAGNADDVAAFVTLADAQMLLDTPGAVSELRVRVWPSVSVADVQRQIQQVRGLSVLRITRGDAADKAMISTLRSHHASIAVATAMAATLCLLVAAWLDAAERRLEFAGLVALGATRRNVLVNVASRSAIVALAGGVVGAFAGSTAAATITDVTVILATAPRIIGLIAVASGGLGVLASLPSAILAAQREPVQDLQEASS